MLTFMNSKLPDDSQISDKLYLVIISALELKVDKQKNHLSFIIHFQNSSVPFHQVTLDHSISRMLLIDNQMKAAKTPKYLK